MVSVSSSLLSRYTSFSPNVPTILTGPTVFAVYVVVANPFTTLTVVDSPLITNVKLLL